MKIASAIVNFFVFYNHDDDTFKRVINPSNYNKWISPEAPHFTTVTWVLMEEEKA